jgi:hypothetical protein
LVAARAADSTSIDTVHERSAIVDSMRERGLEGLLHVFAGRIVTRDIITAELQLAWWRGVLEAIIADRGQLLGADTTILDRLENDYRLVDQAHITGNAQKLAHSLAEAWRIAITDLPDETSAIKTALTVGPTSVSNLVAVAPTLTDILAPVWCISPYEIGTLAPNQRFDVVILVDAGAMSVAEVAPAISRGGQIVTFGDPVTDRPTSFTVTPDDSVEAGLGSRSVLAELAKILPTHAMTMSYRPLGTGLAAQISRQLYSGGLRAWPLASASLGESGLSFITVEGKGPLDEKTGRIEATATELDAIVANVVEHATLHPEHSLMVISASSITVARVQDAIHNALPANRTLQDFFTRHADSPFVVLSLQQASAVTRDRVIFALGFGRRGDVLAQRQFVGHRVDLVKTIGHAVGGHKVDGWEHSVVNHIAPRQQQARRDPTSAVGPTCHIRWVEQFLPEKLGLFVEIGNAGYSFQAHFFIGGNHQLHRRLDARGHTVFAVKIFGQQHGFHEGSDVVVVLSQQVSQLLLQFR